MKKTISIALTTIAILGIIYIYSNSLKINGKISYSATNEVASIKISRFTDYDEFLKAKPSSIIIYNEHNELRNNIEVFMVGEVNLNYDFYRKGAEYKLECIKKMGGVFPDA
ncbi:hypothetical protein [uncultured Clostridium sp.]|uniref:hypothetical protein n=1 Tax=uncultured Clostridium sp. TaxID=59620 RepID=UPI0028EEE50A|nr:hypothetical protein [uncultured Clostridium sp.]